MFMKINTKGANEIVIFIPNNKASESLCAISNMFEQNATFIQNSWRERKIVEPEISIHLGDKLESVAGDENVEIIIVESSEATIGNDFELASTSAFANFKKATDKLHEDIRRRDTENAALKTQITSLKEKVESLLKDDYEEGYE